MNRRRSLVFGLAAFFALPIRVRAQAAPKMVVYKGPQCGCCGEWETHMRKAGFRIDSRVLDDLGRMKRTLGVPADFWTCHTGVVDGYLVEGHVPAADVQRLLRERPKVLGIAVPGMPLGSPGMEQGPPAGYERYETLAFTSQRSWVFERH
jgi:hypothetical protein